MIRLLRQLAHERVWEVTALRAHNDYMKSRLAEEHQARVSAERHAQFLYDAFDIVECEKQELAAFLMGPWVTVNENHVEEADALLKPFTG